MSFPSDIAATWSLLQQLLEKALALPMADRLAWLERSADVPDSLREPLRRLLEVQAGIGTRGFVATFPSADTGLTPSAPVLIGDMVGPYRLLQELGDGGMGSVWLAERADGALKRKVALKLPRLAWASDLAGRMARERDILGALEHPNIARLYDAGLDQHGRPFLALEYVEGQRLDRYCDDNKLTLAERVRLFLQVLDAVQHAHINLVLHRDLKPANILVNQRGEIRLLDFGIAKLIADDAVSGAGEFRSESLSRAMTPRFASPEQVQHSRLTLASDIYSLGVVLYEILTGTSPLITNNGSRAEYEIAIVDGRLRTPSRTRVDTDAALQRRSTPERVARTLRGDLDAVILKALARNATDRYASAEALRADLVRWLDGHPVRATPPSRVVSLKKFVARNAMAVGFSTAAIMAIVATAAIAILQAREAQLESRRATATRDFILSLFENANPELHGGREVSARELLLSNSNAASSALNTQPEIHAEVLRAVADAWGRIGDYEQMIEVAIRRTQILRELKEKSLYFRALLEEAQIEASRENIERVRSVINELTSIKTNFKPDATQESDLFWLKGWLSFADRKYKDSERYFEASEILAPSTDKNRKSRAKFGLMRSLFNQSNRSAAMIAYKEALQHARSKDLPPGERMRRSLEILASIYERGEYLVGWKDVSELYADAAKINGEKKQHDSYATLFWANWAIKVDELALVEKFFTESRNAIQALNNEKENIMYFEWMLTEARLRFAERDYRGVDRILNEIDQKITDSYQKMSLDLIRAENEIIKNNPKKAIEIIYSKRWDDFIRIKSPKADAWLVYRQWIYGIALIELGEELKAYETLSLALSGSKDEFGYYHPNTSKINLAILHAVITSSSLKVSDSELEQAGLAEKNLKQTLPANNRAVRAAREVLRSAGDPGLTRPVSIRSKLGDNAPFL